MLSAHKDPNNRRASFKLPPPRAAQESRRLAALEQQRRRREKQIDAFRSSDFFASVAVVPDSPPSPLSPPFDSNNESAVDIDLTLSPPTLAPSISRRRRSDAAQASKPPKEHRYANKLMYAEVLEFQSEGDMSLDGPGMAPDGLPSDLETEWVAIAPVPVGKRCMAVTYAMNYGNGVVAPPAITALHARVSGHVFLRFTSPLPPDTILDCILDSKWQDTGLLHVLDVMRWRGSDLSTCECDFRLWFLQARMAELPPCAPPTMPPFKHPYMFLPVPFQLPPLSPATLLMDVIPAAKAGRVVPLMAPLPPSPGPAMDTVPVDEYGRALPGSASGGFFVQAGMVQGPRETLVASDGMLLYFKSSTYQSGSTPLCCWVPNLVLEGEAESRLGMFERVVRARAGQDQTPFDQEVQMAE